MAYTPADAKGNMEDLIARLQEKGAQLRTLSKKAGLSSDERADVIDKRAEVLTEVTNRRVTAALVKASSPIIREPSAAERQNLQDSLVLMGKDINSIATVSAVLTFVDEVLTENADRFTEILETIDI